MASSNNLSFIPPSSKKRKRSPLLDYGIATPPKSPSERSSIGQCSKTRNASLPSPPNTTNPYPEPPTPDPSTRLFALIQDVKDGNRLLESETSFCIIPEEFTRFEHILTQNKTLHRYCKKKLRYEWSPEISLFTILRPDAKIQEICSRIAQYLDQRLRELTGLGYVLEELSLWERGRVKELVELIRPLALHTLHVDRRRTSPDLCFTFGTTESRLGVSQKHVGPLVVFEARCMTFTINRAEMERRARAYLVKQQPGCPFRHEVKTVVLVHYTRGASGGARDVQIMVSRLKVENGERTIATQIVGSSSWARSGHVDLMLSDFLPQDAIELGFEKDENGRRACDDIMMGINLAGIVRHVLGCEQRVLQLDDGNPAAIFKRRRVGSFGGLEERPCCM